MNEQIKFRFYQPKRKNNIATVWITLNEESVATLKLMPGDSIDIKASHEDGYAYLYRVGKDIPGLKLYTASQHSHKLTNQCLITKYTPTPPPGKTYILDCERKEATLSFSFPPEFLKKDCTKTVSFAQEKMKAKEAGRKRAVNKRLNNQKQKKDEKDENVSGVHLPKRTLEKMNKKIQELAQENARLKKTSTCSSTPSPIINHLQCARFKNIMETLQLNEEESLKTIMDFFYEKLEDAIDKRKKGQQLLKEADEMLDSIYNKI